MDTKKRKFLKPRRNNRKISITKQPVNSPQKIINLNQQQRHYQELQEQFITTYEDLSKECGTQTSTTLLLYNHMKENMIKNDDAMSLDSLTFEEQVKNCTNFQKIAAKKYSSTHLINFNVESKNMNSTEQIFSTRDEITNEPCTDDSLIKIYLTKFHKKSKDKNALLGTDNTNYEYRRCDFLLQTSPFKRLLKEETSMSSMIKSKTHIESNLKEKVESIDGHNYINNGDYYKIFDDKSIIERDSVDEVVRVMSVNEKNEKFCNYCDKNTQYYLAKNKNSNLTPESMQNQIKNYLNDNNRYRYCKIKSKSFMSDTIASKQKNILSKVKSVDCLVSPVYKGHIVKAPNNIKYHVPYIDDHKSNSDMFDYTYKKILMKTQSIIKLNGDHIAQNDAVSLDTMGIQPPLHETAIGNLMNRIKDPDWNVSLKGLADFVTKCANNLEEYYDHLPTVQQRLLELVKSSRWYASKSACQICANLFEITKDTRRPEFDEMVDALLSKTADFNRNIRNEANLALDCMVTNIPFNHAFRALTSKGPNHKNHLVRLATIRLIICSIVLLNPTVLFNPTSNDILRKKVIEIMVKFVFDKNQAVRRYGERLYKILQKEPDFMLYMKRYIERKEVNEFLKCVKNLTNII